MKKIMIAAASLATLAPFSVEARMAYLRSGDPGAPRALELVPSSLDRQALRQEADMQVRSSISPGPALVDFFCKPAPRACAFGGGSAPVQCRGC